MSTALEAGRPSGRELATAASHPEEMKAAFDLTLGSTLSLKASARATPAGLIAAALLVTAIIVPVIWFLPRRT